MSGLLSHPLRFFAAATLSPAILLALSSVFAGWFSFFAMLYMTALAYGLDGLVTRKEPALSDERIERAADILSSLLAISHFIILGLTIYSLSGGFEHSTASAILLFLAAGLFFGQVSNSNAHELIHRSNRALRLLGKLVYVSLLFGHHSSAHPKIHHRFVATPDDPNTAQKDESFYDFAKRAWGGAFIAGYEIEQFDLKRRKSRAINPYYLYISGSVLMLCIAILIGGLVGLALFALLCLHAQMQLLLSDYVQHYGLLRERLRDGSYAPVDMTHSWNAPHWFTSHLMLNAPRHSDHHAHPMRPYPALNLPEKKDVPTLPYSLPMMAMIALIPPLWFKIMNRALEKWQRR